MANKTMPERIWAWEQDGFRDFDNMAGWKENGIESDFEGAEYVRADLATGDANEPLELYQCRWIKISKALHDGEREWLVARVDFDEDDYGNEVLCFYGIDGDEYWKGDVDVIGPVIRPPADTAN